MGVGSNVLILCVYDGVVIKCPRCGPFSSQLNKTKTSDLGSEFTLKGKAPITYCLRSTLPALIYRHKQM